MSTYIVWDKINGSEETAETIEFLSPNVPACVAAEKYAEEDVDGEIDGWYCGSGKDLCVKSSDGQIKVYRVTCEYNPSYYATLID